MQAAFTQLNHLRPGSWNFLVHDDITKFDQYEHLAQIARLAQENKELRAVMGDYLIVPDIVISRSPVSDEEINQHQVIVSNSETCRVHAFIRPRHEGAPHEHLFLSE